MNRRALLGSVGALVSGGSLFAASERSADELHVRFWLSDRAARYDRIPARINEYLLYALDLDWWSVDVSYGGVVGVETEDGYDVTVGGEWPRKVVTGAITGDLSPARHVNLLVTDGAMDEAPTGAGLPRIASVGGARHLARVPSIDDRSPTVAYSNPDRVMQVLVHEVGHALGLGHDHGVTFREGDAVVATPMISAYAWDPTYEATDTRCGSALASVAGADRKLTYAFSACARSRLRRSRRELVS